MESTGILPDRGQDNIIQIFTELLQKDVKEAKRLLAIASPGTGKTTTISRILEIIILLSRNSSFVFSKVLVLTFTKKTKSDLFKKIKQMTFNPELQRAKGIVMDRIKTFHSFARSLIKWKKLLSQDDQQKMIKGYIQKFIKDPFRSSQAQKLAWIKIKQIFTSNLSVEEQLQKLKVKEQNIPICFAIQSYFTEIQKLYRENQTVSHDQSLIKALEVIHDSNYVVKEQFDPLDINILIVDQFQDINQCQIEIIKGLISRKKVHLLMVGDIDQNIYTWRGSKYMNIRKFINEENFKKQYLTNTYRLTNKMIEVSQSIINSNEKYQIYRNQTYPEGVTLESKNFSNNQAPKIIVFEKDQVEVRYIVDQIIKHREEGIQYGDMAILLRTVKCLFVKKLILEIKRRQQQDNIKIPYDLQFHRSVFTSKNVKFIMNILNYFEKKKYTVEKKNKQISSIITSIVKIGQGDQVLKRMLKQDIISENLVYYEEKRYQSRKKVYDIFFKAFNKLEALIEDDHKDVSDAIEEIAEILSQCQAISSFQKDQKLNEFINFAENFNDYYFENTNNQSSQLMKLSKFMRDNNHQKQRNAMLEQMSSKRVQIQTVHSSKGLQYKVVFLPALNSNYVQEDFNEEAVSCNQAQKKRILEESIEKCHEQLRLFYVAITRSRQYNYISRSGIISNNIGLNQPFNPYFAHLAQKFSISSTIKYDQNVDGKCRQFIKKAIEEEQQKKVAKNIRKMQKKSGKNTKPIQLEGQKQQGQANQREQVEQNKNKIKIQNEQENKEKNIKVQENVANENKKGLSQKQKYKRFWHNFMNNSQKKKKQDQS